MLRFLRFAIVLMIASLTLPGCHGKHRGAVVTVDIGDDCKLYVGGAPLKNLPAGTIVKWVNDTDRTTRVIFDSNRFLAGRTSLTIRGGKSVTTRVRTRRDAHVYHYWVVCRDPGVPASHDDSGTTTGGSGGDKVDVENPPTP